MVGMQLAIELFGTKSDLVTCVAPAISLTRGGVHSLRGDRASDPLARCSSIRRFSGSTRLLLIDGEPPAPRALFRNPDFATMTLKSLVGSRGGPRRVLPRCTDPGDRLLRGVSRQTRDAVTFDDMASPPCSREGSAEVFEWMRQRVYTAQAHGRSSHEPEGTFQSSRALRFLRGFICTLAPSRRL